MLYAVSAAVEIHLPLSSLSFQGSLQKLYQWNPITTVSLSDRPSVTEVVCLFKRNGQTLEIFKECMTVYINKNK